MVDFIGYLETLEFVDQAVVEGFYFYRSDST